MNQLDAPLEGGGESQEVNESDSVPVSRVLKPRAQAQEKPTGRDSELKQRLVLWAIRKLLGFDVAEDETADLTAQLTEQLIRKTAEGL